MPASDLFADEPLNYAAPAYDAAAISPNDGADLTYVTRGIYVGGAGDVKVNMQGEKGAAGGAAIIFKAVPVGTILPIAASRVYSTGTTATLLVALW